MAVDVPRCGEMVGEPPHYLHEHRCDRRARYRVYGPNTVLVVCGIHRRSLLRRGYVEHPDTEGEQDG